MLLTYHGAVTKVNGLTSAPPLTLPPQDTAIKNAAGAIAKVLGRVCTQGLSCPVYTERKTEQAAGVISVAVKVSGEGRSSGEVGAVF